MSTPDGDHQMAAPAPRGQTSCDGGAERIVTYRGTVYPSQCDHMGHMNVMWYVAKFDEASWQLLAMLGLTASRFRSEGIGMAAVDQHLEYRRELHAGDAVTIRSAIVGVAAKSIRVTHQMSNDETGEVAATTIVVAVHLDTTIRRARELPPDVRERATCMAAEGAGSAGQNGFINRNVPITG